MFINLMKKTVSKFWQYWQRFWEPTDEIPFIVKLSLGVLAVATVAVTVSESATGYLQQLLIEKHYVLETIGYCVVGVVSMWLAWAANKRANAIDATAKEQAKATANTEAGQRQERLKNAIEHLGHGSDSVRMGGAYELFHLAKDTKDLRQTVLDILCAHIRQTTGENKYEEKHGAEPSEEIQSLLSLLFMDEHDVFEDCSIKLQNSYLNGANLFKARLKKADLIEAQLQKADLRYAQLQEADFYNTQLQEAVLGKAQLQGAKLWQAHLQGVDLSAAQLQGANLTIARLQGADLSMAQLQGASLMIARLQGANLSTAQLQGADFRKAQLQGAFLMGAQLQGISSQEIHLFPPAGFESKIRIRIGKDSDLKGITFAGGLQQEDLDALCEDLSAEKAQMLRKTLRPHVGKPASHELSKNSGAVIGAYTEKEAKQWIAEYNKAMQKVPSAGDS